MLASSPDVASYEPVFLTEAEVNPAHPVTLVVALGGSSLDARDLLPPRRRIKGTILETTVDPHLFVDQQDTTVDLRQTHPIVDAAWNASCVRLRFNHVDAFCATVHVVGASGLPRRGVVHEVFKYLAPVFALVMQTNVEMTAAARALTDDWRAKEQLEQELRNQAMNPSFEKFKANRIQQADVDFTNEAADYLLPESPELSRETLKALAAARPRTARARRRRPALGGRRRPGVVARARPPPRRTARTRRATAAPTALLPVDLLRGWQQQRRGQQQPPSTSCSAPPPGRGSA